MRRSPFAAVLVLAALSLTACGSRLDTQLRQDAADQALGRNGNGSFVGSGDGALNPVDGGTGTGTGTGGTGTSGTGGTGTGGTGTGTGTAGTGGTGTGGTGTGTGGTAGAPAPAGGNGGATDVGVTATTLTVGIVADLSGPIPGLFQGAVAGTQAYIAKVNSEGGIYGRKLKLDVRDSQLECGQYKAEAIETVAKNFAMVGSFSLYDNCGVDAMKSKPTFPDVHSALGNDAQKVPNNFSVAPLASGWRLGPLVYMQKRFGDRFNKIGSIYAAVGGGAESWANAKAAITKVGGAVIDDRAFQPTDTDFTADIIRMRQKGVQMIYMPATNAATAANVLKAARSQQVDWPIVFGGPAYDRAFLQQAGAQAEGVFEDQQYSLFFNEEDAAVIPGVKDYQIWMKRVGANDNMDLFSAYGWSSAMLLTQALKAAGPKATRAGVIAELRKIKTFDGNGILAPANPADKKPATCWLFSQVKNGKWIRVDTPRDKYRCDGGYFFA